MNAVQMFLWVMQAAVIVLRLCGVIDWPWWVALAWIEVVIALWLVGFALGLVLCAIEWLAWRRMTPDQRARVELARSLRAFSERLSGRK